MRLSEVTLEAVYKGNMGVMEFIKFLNSATKSEKDHMQKLLDTKKWKAAWDYLKQKSGVALMDV